MNKLIFVSIASLSILFTQSLKYEGGTLAPVILAGSIVKHEGTEIVNKYPRKKCPVCKGTGKYLSGDGIKMVDCGYCEPEKSDVEQVTQKNKSPFCKCQNCECENCQCKPKNVIVIRK